MSADTAIIESPDVSSDGKILCHIDNQRVHSIQSHIHRNYADTWSIERYKSEYPDMPIFSAAAQGVLDKRAAEAFAATAATRATASMIASASVGASAVSTGSVMTTSLAQFHELFDLGVAPAAMNAQGKPIGVTVMSGHDLESQNYLVAIDKGYVYEIDLLKKVILAYQLNMPVYLWGFHGTGKTTLFQQAAARTGRPFLRVQHTIGLQESDVTGQWTVRDGSTIFQLGPLAQAMLNGWVYCADEYDFAMPSVLAVYQPVLEGQALLIKDAPPEMRKIEPHPNFRFCATGNTNGTGDETGLYQGTMVQNAANYSRFKITEEVKYMTSQIEENILCSKMAIDRKDAKKIVKFANEVRDMFRNQKISTTVSPRELLSAVEIGVAYGGNWSQGLELAFANRLSRIDRATVVQYMQRLFV
jgi:cobaltochelatase CobS